MKSSWNRYLKENMLKTPWFSTAHRQSKQGTTTGKPIRMPFNSSPSVPLTTAGTYSLGTAPPTMALLNSKPANVSSRKSCEHQIDIGAGVIFHGSLTAYGILDFRVLLEVISCFKILQKVSWFRRVVFVNLPNVGNLYER